MIKHRTRMGIADTLMQVPDENRARLEKKQRSLRTSLFQTLRNQFAMRNIYYTEEQKSGMYEKNRNL